MANDEENQTTYTHTHIKSEACSVMVITSGNRHVEPCSSLTPMRFQFSRSAYTLEKQYPAILPSGMGN